MISGEKVVDNFPHITRWEEFEDRYKDIIKQLEPFHSMVVAVPEDDRTAALLLIMIFLAQSEKASTRPAEEVSQALGIPKEIIEQEITDICRCNSYLMGCMVDRILGSTEQLWYALNPTTSYLKDKLAKEREARQSN